MTENVAPSFQQVERAYLKASLLLIMTNLTQPLLGAVDTAVIGRFGSEADLAAVAIGAVIFNTLYWLLSFLRVNTTALSAQSQTGKENSFFENLGIPLIFACLMGLLMILFATPIKQFFFFWLSPEEIVKGQLEIYYNILIGGAPFVLMNYVSLGWLIGKMNIKASMFIQIAANLINITLNLLLCYVFRTGILGIALSTLCAQMISWGIGFWYLKDYLKQVRLKKIKGETLSQFKGMMIKNGDLFLRTLCIVMQNNIFSKLSLSFGTAMTAGNALILQVISILSYLFEGLGNTTSVYSGKAIGEGSKEKLEQAVKLSRKWTFIVVLCQVFLLLTSSKLLLSLFTNKSVILEATTSYQVYLIVYPLVAGIGLSYYGLFSGAGKTAIIRNSALVSFVLYLGAVIVLVPLYKNHGLWIAYLIFYAIRSLVMYYNSKKIQI